MVNYDGEISPCCFHYPFCNISDIDKNDVWNGNEMRELRTRWVEGNLKGTPCYNCVGLSTYQYKYPIVDDIKGRYSKNYSLNISEYLNNTIDLKSMPIEMVYVPGTLCNINCIHCCQPESDKSTTIKIEYLSSYYNKYGQYAIKNSFSGGEPLALKGTFEIIKMFSKRQVANSELTLLTNGLLLNNKMESLPRFKQYVLEWSIASFKRETYEYIHQASYDKLIANLDYVRKLRNAGYKIKVIRIIALMKSNIYDLQNVMAENAEYGIDDMWILPTHSSDGKYKSLWAENIISFPFLIKDNKQLLDICDSIDYPSAKTSLVNIYNALPVNMLQKYIMSYVNLIKWYMRVVMLRVTNNNNAIRRLVRKIKWSVS